MAQAGELVMARPIIRSHEKAVRVFFITLMLPISD
jgi:hypothetical protein